MKVTLKDNELTIVMQCGDLEPSKSGKSLILASTRGNKTTSVQVDGKALVVSVNAYISAAS